MRTRFTREANAFRSSCDAFHTQSTRISHAERTRFGPCANTFHTQSERVLVLVRTRFTRSERVSLGTYTRLRVKHLYLTGTVGGL